MSISIFVSSNSKSYTDSVVATDSLLQSLNIFEDLEDLKFIEKDDVIVISENEFLKVEREDSDVVHDNLIIITPENNNMLCPLSQEKYPKVIWAPDLDKQQWCKLFQALSEYHNTCRDYLGMKRGQKSLKSSVKNLKNNRSISTLERKLANTLKELQEMALTADCQDELNDAICSFLKNNKWASDYKFCDYFEEKSDFDYIYPIITVDNNIKYLYLKYTNQNDLVNDLLGTSLLTILSQFEKRSHFLKEMMAQSKVWVNIFNSIPLPLALFTLEGELLFYNNLFLKRGLINHTFESFKSKKSIVIEKSSYSILKRTFCSTNEDYLFFIFGQTSSVYDSLDTQQLGIISSSVAHELNNPLAGILASLAVLEIEIEDNDHNNEKVQTLQEMKDSAKRCKRLIETFLGFSKTRVESHVGSLNSSIDQSLNLMRSRMIESNVTILVDRDSNNLRLIYPHNYSILTMILYLFLGDLLTSYSHFMLLTFGQRSTENTINLKVGNTIGGLSIGIHPKFDVSSSLKENNLLNYLLDIEKIFIRYEENVLEFVEYPSYQIGKKEHA